MKKQLNHSRYIDNGAKDIADSAYEYAKTTPTAKQIKFYKKLYALCKENEIDPVTRHEHTRMGYARAIDLLLNRLKEHGVDINGNGKNTEYVLKIGEDRRGRDCALERIEVKRTSSHAKEV